MAAWETRHSVSRGDVAAFIDVLPDGVVVADGDGLVTAMNPAAARLLGVDRDSAVGSHVADVMALQDLEGHDWFGCVDPYDGLAIRRTLAEAAWLTEDGREVLVTGSLHRQRVGDKVDRLALCLRDARARERLDRARSDLVATVAHELRSPLTGVKGFTATLLSKWDRLTDSQKLLMLQTVDADADRLTRLIAELLDVARIDSGRLSLRSEPVDLAEAVRRQIEPLARASERVITVDAPDRPRVWVDRDKFAEVVANLVDNAIKHGQGHIAVAVRGTGDGGAELVVDDEGPGIPVDIRPRIFSKFWRHGDHSGSGLGLYIACGLVQAHHGAIYVEESPTHGARMRVQIPEGRPAGVEP